MCSYVIDEKDVADGRDYKIKRSVMIGRYPREVHIQAEDCGASEPGKNGGHDSERGRQISGKDEWARMTSERGQGQLERGGACAPESSEKARLSEEHILTSEDNGVLKLASASALKTTCFEWESCKQGEQLA